MRSIPHNVHRCFQKYAWKVSGWVCLYTIVEKYWKYKLVPQVYSKLCQSFVTCRRVGSLSSKYVWLLPEKFGKINSSTTNYGYERKGEGKGHNSLRNDNINLQITFELPPPSFIDRQSHITHVSSISLSRQVQSAQSSCAALKFSLMFTIYRDIESLSDGARASGLTYFSTNKLMNETGKTSKGQFQQMSLKYGWFTALWCLCGISCKRVF